MNITRGEKSGVLKTESRAFILINRTVENERLKKGKKEVTFHTSEIKNGLPASSDKFKLQKLEMNVFLFFSNFFYFSRCSCKRDASGRKFFANSFSNIFRTLNLMNLWKGCWDFFESYSTLPRFFIQHRPWRWNLYSSFYGLRELFRGLLGEIKKLYSRVRKSFVYVCLHVRGSWFSCIFLFFFIAHVMPCKHAIRTGISLKKSVYTEFMNI